MNDEEIIKSLSRIETNQSNIFECIDEMKDYMIDISNRVSILERQQAECKGRQKFQIALVGALSAAASAGVTGSIMTIVGGV